MADVTTITSHVVDAVNRIITQYKDKPKLAGIITAFASNIQDLEDSTYGMVALRALVNATGAQLDRIGEIVGISRQSFDDDFYRILIYVQIGKNTSQANAEKIISIFALLTEANVVHLINLNAGSIQLLTDGVIDEDKVNFIFQNMEDVVGSGIRIDHIMSFDDDSFAFEGVNSNSPGKGFGDSSDALVGGLFATLHQYIKPFAFAGNDISAEGFSSLDDPLAGGNLVGIGG